MPGGRSDPIGPSQLSASVFHHTGAQIDRGLKTLNMPCIPSPLDPKTLKKIITGLFKKQTKKL